MKLLPDIMLCFCSERAPIRLQFIQFKALTLPSLASSAFLCFAQSFRSLFVSQQFHCDYFFYIKIFTSWMLPVCSTIKIQNSLILCSCQLKQWIEKWRKNLEFFSIKFSSQFIAFQFNLFDYLRPKTNNKTKNSVRLFLMSNNANNFRPWNLLDDFYNQLRFSSLRSLSLWVLTSDRMDGFYACVRVHVCECIIPNVT